MAIDVKSDEETLSPHHLAQDHKKSKCIGNGRYGCLPPVQSLQCDHGAYMGRLKSAGFTSMKRAPITIKYQ